MYWLLPDDEKDKVRNDITKLVGNLSLITGSPQTDQLFPFVGRKDRRKAAEVVKVLTTPADVVVDPFSGSGIFVYAAAQEERDAIGNEWEPYTHRISSAPWRLPLEEEIQDAVDKLTGIVKDPIEQMYGAVCDCGAPIVIDSQFFDRHPLRYSNVTPHERLGRNGETITYRGQFQCQACGRKEKLFTEDDQRHLDELDRQPILSGYRDIFNRKLIPNSRINLSGAFIIYGNLFPHRSKLVLSELFEGIKRIKVSDNARKFMEDAFLSIIPQAKYKDYRSKSQDLHVPEVQLREVNLLHRFLEQTQSRGKGLNGYLFAGEHKISPIQCKDFRDFLGELEGNSVDLLLTDPPWTDGTAYFEKAQLYHPWIGYNLRTDADRLEKECVVTDAPTRSLEHDLGRWWEDIEKFFELGSKVLKENKYLSLFFRPIPASTWLQNLNHLKLIARKTGFEPLLSIDVSGSDPSMRIQQSAAYVFSRDVIFVFLKLPPSLRRVYIGDIDIDHLAYQVAEEVQEEMHGPFDYRTWREKLAQKALSIGAGSLNLPDQESEVRRLFDRYCEEVREGSRQFLPKADTPFSGQLFDTPAIERLFNYVPSVIEDITKLNDTFSYDMFLLKLAEYVENGTRMLIDQVGEINIKSIIEPYAEPLERGKMFRKRSLPALPGGIKNVLELDPYDFEAFVGKLLERQGYTSIALIGRSGDRGVDLIAIDPEGKKVVVQCKRYLRSNVDATPVQRLHSFSVTRGADRRILVTTSSFTPQAKQEAESTGTELVDCVQLEGWIAEYMPDYLEG